jgi:hypothetical protein
LTIPPNAQGRLPLTTEQAARFKLDGQSLESSTRLKFTSDGTRRIYELPAGTYAFNVVLSGASAAASGK